MALLDTAMVSIHLLFAGLWTGGVVFMVGAVLPAARDGSLSAEALGFLTGRLVTLSRLSALVLLLTGGHMAGTGYTVGSLTGSGRGHLVLTMVVLWFVLAAIVEVGSRKLRGTGSDDGVVAAAAARPYFLAAAAVALLLLVDGGLLAGGVA